MPANYLVSIAANAMLTRAFSNRTKQNGLVFSISLVCILAAFVMVANSAHSNPQENLSQGLKYFEDRNQSLDIMAIQALPQNLWQQAQGEVLSFDKSEHPYWLTFELAPAEKEQSWLLELDYSLLDKLSIWFVTQQGIASEYHHGDANVFAQRLFKHKKGLFPVPHTGQTSRVFVRIQSGVAMKIPIRLRLESAYVFYGGEQSIAMGLFFGFMATMGLGNFFFFITTRINTFLVYSAFVLCLALSLAPLHVLPYTYLGPNSPLLHEHSVSIFANASIVFALVFSDLLLDVKSHSPPLSRLLKVSAGLFLLCLLISLFLPHALVVKGLMFILPMVILLICSVSTRLWAKGLHLAGFYTLAWVALLLSVSVIALDNFNLLKLDIAYHELLMMGASITTTLLALVLALRYSQQRQDTFDAQVVALNVERDTQGELLNLQTSARKKLEYNVQERTLELEVALRELSEKNRQLEEKNTPDALTGIGNRSYFDKKYTAEVRRSRRQHTELSVVMIDIDHFKRVNDQHGHLVGDECIKFVAKTLQDALKRPSDNVCRYGGEEFALILPSTDLAGAHSLVEQVRQYIHDKPVVTNGLTIYLSISAGIATAIAQAQQADDALLACADQQLYLAKNAGRNRVQALQFMPSPNNKKDQVDV